MNSKEIDSMEKDNRKIIIYHNIVKLIFFSILSLIFTLAGMLLALEGLRTSLTFINITIQKGYSSTFVTIIGIVGLVIFSPMTFYCVRKIIIWKPSLIIDENGIIDNASYTSAGYLPWHEIEDVCIYKVENRAGSQLILGIKLKNREEFINKFRGLRKVFLKMGKYPVNIPQNMINIEIGEVYKYSNKN
jgi:hypothetical protein